MLYSSLSDRHRLERMHYTLEHLDPDLSRLIRRMPALKSSGLDAILEFRKILALGAAIRKRASHPGVIVSDLFITNPNSAQSLRLRRYEPRNAPPSPRPALLWMHGGGMACGAPENDEPMLIRFAHEGNITVFAVDYRLAPEHPYPAQLDDCETAFRALLASATPWTIDLHRIALGGASAGANLAIALTLRLRDHAIHPVKFLLAIYPMLDEAMSVPSLNATFEPPMMDALQLRNFWKHYRQAFTGDSKYMDPYLETDWHAFPTTYTCVGQIDPSRDTTLIWADALHRALVRTECHLFPGAMHGFDAICPQALISENAMAEWSNRLCATLRVG